MNVCLATHEYLPEPGGIATYYGMLAGLLAAAGHGVTILTLSDGGGNPPDSVRIVDLRSALEEKKRTLQPFFDPIHWRTIYFLAVGLVMREWLLAHPSFDVVETVDFGGYGALFSDIKLPPLVVTCHGSLGQLRHYEQAGVNDDERVLMGLEALLLGSAAEVMTHSPTNAEDWAIHLGRNVHLATAPWQATEIGERDVSGSVRPVRGLVVGRLQNWKGAETTVESLRRCVEQNLAVEVQWVGRDTPTNPDGESMAGYLQHSYPDCWGRNFHWIEHLPRQAVRSAQRDADFVLVPSLWDVFNYTALEAMSLGTPVIVSAGAGISYLCRDGDNSLVVPAGDVNALADAIRRLCQDEKLRRKIGAAGRAMIDVEFAPDKIVQERLAVYRAAGIRHQRRQEKPYTPSPLHPLLSQFLDFARCTDDLRFDRLGGRRLAVEAGRRLLSRFVPAEQRQ